MRQPPGAGARAGWGRRRRGASRRRRPMRWPTTTGRVVSRADPAVLSATSCLGEGQPGPAAGRALDWDGGRAGGTRCGGPARRGRPGGGIWAQSRSSRRPVAAACRRRVLSARLSQRGGAQRRDGSLATRGRLKRQTLGLEREITDARHRRNALRRSRGVSPSIHQHQVTLDNDTWATAAGPAGDVMAGTLADSAHQGTLLDVLAGPWKSADRSESFRHGRV